MPHHSPFINYMFRESHNVPATVQVQPERETSHLAIAIQCSKCQREEDPRRGSQDLGVGETVAGDDQLTDEENTPPPPRGSHVWTEI